MHLIPGYEIKETVFASEKTIIYRCIQEVTGQNTIIKTLNYEYPSAHDLAQLKHEYTLLKKVHCDGVVSEVEFLTHGVFAYIVLDDFNGISLNYLMDRPCP